MTRWHNHYLDGHPHFCTASALDWERVLVGSAVDVLYQEWDSARKALGVKVLAYIIMPDHFHIVLWAEKGDLISMFLRRTQSLTSRRIRPGLSLWKERPRVLALYSSSALRTKVDYLHRNPVRAELVENPEEWEHSSYRQLVLGEPGRGFVCDSWEGINI
ncbi:MAG: transposase [Armatimonadetes bacterium]|nr:transposase [Armatimonadota bacterium]